MGICSGKQQPSRHAKQHLSEIKRFAKQNIRQFYRFGKVLGSGSFGTVKVGYSVRDSKEFAIKTIHKYRMREQFYLVLRELDILTQLDHPNIIKVFEEYEDDMYYHFVMEYCSGGELLERIVEKGYIGESESKVIMQQLFSAINYLHSMGIAHRDLKPENILFASKDKDAPIKVIDFGLSKKFRNINQKLQRMNSKVGTPIYVAPEILSGDYSFQCDEWSLGCIMHVLLCGNPPFQAKQLDKLEVKIKHSEVDFSFTAFDRVSSEAKNLIKSLLVKQPKKRITCEKALEHQWFKNMKLSSHQQQLTNSDHQKILRLLHTYANSSKLKKETLKILINQLTQSQISQLKEVFTTYDKDCNGTISIQELLQIMANLGFKKSEEELVQMIKKFNNINPSSDDITQDTQITYTSFLSALVNCKSFLNKERLWNLFKYFDSNNQNFITIEDVRKAFEREGRQLSQSKLISLFQEIMQNEEQKTIDFEQFCQMMQDNLYNSNNEKNNLEQELDCFEN
ncbi:unnamed protein product (macronuclear) [Paramecium tetraurelia]|uniref:Uncharacterized protein n=1 Tax=Paramecium tetraurelia TaxID=5888 RepID=A0CYE6_PARTE|nr:uncharacterized protein GSPATT00011413001 [Paramecium tetraurelia]CAK75813.1 unnamed protein product [Paramecium tetraurelia]|eukprot:XP_001443210.1 hypothetical protein (macronuclear) [Paramecium tetraurelia strain d4-2]